MKTYSTSLDKLAKIITLFVTVLFLAIIIGQFFMSGTAPEDKIILVFVSFSLVLTYALCYLFRPIEYQLTDSQLIIHRLLKDVVIERSDIADLRQLAPEQLSGSIRTFGVGGLFGYFGEFSNPKLGSMTWYATRRDNAILVTTNDNKRLLLTPDEPTLLFNDYKS